MHSVSKANLRNRTIASAFENHPKIKEQERGSVTTPLSRWEHVMCRSFAQQGQTIGYRGARIRQGASNFVMVGSVVHEQQGSIKFCINLYFYISERPLICVKFCMEQLTQRPEFCQNSVKFCMNYWASTTIEIHVYVCWYPPEGLKYGRLLLIQT